jgi:VWFA-related protein
MSQWGYGFSHSGTARAQAALNATINRVDSSAFPQVQAYVTVSDQNGLPIGGLTSGNFEIVEDGQAVSALTVEDIQSSSEPVALALALDLSGSMLGAPLADTLSAADQLVGQLGAADEITLITFSDQPNLVVSLTTDKAQISTAFSTLKAQGGTALWDAVHEATRQLASRPVGRRAIIVVTDGQDTNSLLNLDDVASDAARQYLPVFPVGFGSVDEVLLGRLAVRTGGEAFIVPASDQLQTQLEAILSRLRQQYLITFASAVPADGAEHRLTVRVNNVGAKAEASAAFVATPVDYSVSLPGFSDGQQIGIGIPNRLAPEFSALAAIRSVEYQLDGSTLATVTVPPFEHSWTPTEAEAGSRELTVRATDAVGNVREQSLALEIVPALTISVVAPKADDAVFGNVSLEAEVKALSTVTTVDFLVDGKSVGTANAAPYLLDWDSGTVAAGSHELTVVVSDAYGQTAEASVPFRVQVGINWGLFGVIALVLVAFGLVVPLSLRMRRDRAAAKIPTPAATGPASVPLNTSSAPGPAQLIVEAGDEKGQSWTLGSGDTRIGRQRAENDVVLSGTDVSRRHAVIRGDGGRFIFVNLSQTAASLVNGKEVSNQCVLADGDRIEIGEFVLKFSGPQPNQNTKSV